MLKDLRILRGLTQKELANRTNYSREYISDLERNKYKNITIPTIVDLSIGLEISPLLLACHFIDEELKKRDK
ncbi:TPA: helix-turn-helix transcriptional regulator [Clostridioides difficile]|uniref:helix-turn-helix domain-containing protein n=1 Tax=Clostridioides difficile TaxID=1496 RepID=UPI00030E55C7|nr:helix-turn-helix transcriptional regulator [Clostridioides difficile]EGT2202195.1 helix-turn-helix domain-containing protein [Clostridioides difficile]EGT2232757.1 helix-turn-helix domain-containing protein [Clostridioides difficile]EGT4250020.1 XRE family transcriptional regulator [Clostridioides difficile]EGT4519887.1 XRE family transcriptional regulator [Clostridioides difficile]EGT4534978.1 XRE family transcriptional regulator [Clostridioides difficile]